jgi:hypothetical protein
MGFELDAFLGRASELETWKERLPSAVVCPLGGDLGLVPVTGELSQQIRTRMGEEEGVRRWGAEASVGTAVAYVSVGEFGNQSHEEATLWSNGRELLSGAAVSAVLDYFRDRAGLDLGTAPIDLERHRGEDAAEKWVAAATRRKRPRA